MSEGLQGQVKTSLLQERNGQRETLYGLVNAVTNVAQTLLPDDRYSLETLAGRLLERGLPKKESASEKPRLRDRFPTTLFDDELVSG